MLTDFIVSIHCVPVHKGLNIVSINIAEKGSKTKISGIHFLLFFCKNIYRFVDLSISFVAVLCIRGDVHCFSRHTVHASSRNEMIAGACSTIGSHDNSHIEPLSRVSLPRLVRRDRMVAGHCIRTLRTLTLPRSPFAGWITGDGAAWCTIRRLRVNSLS